MSNSVPKFSSFRPKQNPQTEPESTSVSKPDSRENHRHSSDKRHRGERKYERESSHYASRDHEGNDRHSHHHRRPQKDSEPRPDRSSVSRKAFDKAKDIDLDHDDATLFVSDRKGDPENLTYGTLHRYSISDYRRTGYGQIMGLPSKERIDRELSGLHEIYVSGMSRSVANADASILRYQRPEKERRVRFVRTGQEEQTFHPDQDVVHLSRGTKRERGSTHGYARDYGEVDYRSIEGKAKPSREQADSDVETASSEDDQDIFKDDVGIRNKNADLSRRVKDLPTDVTAWLDLIDHQAAMVNPGLEPSQFSNVERRTLSDLRLSLFAKAIKVVTKADSERLSQLMLLEGSKIWDMETLLRSIKEALSDLSHSMSLWTLYLDTVQSSSTGFRYEDTKRALIEIMRMIYTISRKSSSEHRIHDIGLHVLVRITSFIRDAGYTELSIAIWQTIIHAQLAQPYEAAGGDSQSLLEIEQWWDDEGPRLGESGYRDWPGAIRNDSLPTIVNESEQLCWDQSLPFRSFAIKEASQEANFRFPGRTIDEDGPDDPFHVVFFSDIRPFLEVSIRYNAEALINAYLNFFSLPPVPRPNEPPPSETSGRNDPFLHEAEHSHLLPSNDLSAPAINTSHPTTRTLFSRSTWPSITSTQTQVFLKHSLESFLVLSPSIKIQEYYLAFTLTYFSSVASKTAKNVLKTQPQAVRLWNAAAMVEYRLGRHEKAEQIWEGALGLMTDGEGQAGFEKSVDAMVLVQCWTWIYLERGDRQAALKRLVRLRARTIDVTGDGEVSVAARLGLQKYLQEIFASSGSSSFATAESSVLSVELLVLLQYLTASEALPAAFVEFDRCCAILKKWANDEDAAYALEMAHQFQTQLITNHVQQKQPYKPLSVRKRLEACIQVYPHNSVFATAFSQLFRHQSRVDEAVRRTIRWTMFAEPETTTMAGWTMAAVQEISRYEAQAGSTAENVRAVFRRATSAVGSPFVHSMRLWWLWFGFEQTVLSRLMHRMDVSKSKHARKELAKQLEHSKQVFLDGLRQTPWSKDWILAGLACFDQAASKQSNWSTSELRKVHDVLHERELRVRAEWQADDMEI